MIDFSPSMGPDSLAQWLIRQEYGSDYHEDVEKLCGEFWLIEIPLTMKTLPHPQ